MDSVLSAKIMKIVEIMCKFVTYVVELRRNLNTNKICRY